MKKMFLFSLLFILVLAPLCLADFSIRLVSHESLIQQGEEAKFVISIVNEGSERQTFFVRFPNSDWTSFTNPLSDYTFSIDAGKSRLLNVAISPRLNFQTGPYAVPVSIKSDKFEAKQLNLPIQLYTPESREYVPIVNHEVIVSFENDPREEINVEVALSNLNLRNISELFIEVSSKYFFENRTINLLPMSKKSESFTFNVDPLLSPTDDKIKVDVWAYHGGRKYSWSKEINYKITSYSNLVQKSFEDKSFLKKEVKIILKNDANVNQNYEIPFKISLLKGLFTSFEPKSSYKISSSDGRFLVWNLNLDAQEEFEISIKTSYRWLAFIILLILIGIVLYFVFRPPICVKKEVSHVGTSEGGISDIKVILFIKNRTNKIVEDISVVEKIPHLVSIGKEFQVGTLMPSKVMQNPKKGTLVRWDLQTLEAHEERIITYKIKSKLSILGGLTLPASVVKYSVKGKESKTQSNRLVLEI
jgi:hypothetical protein